MRQGDHRTGRAQGAAVATAPDGLARAAPARRRLRHPIPEPESVLLLLTGPARVVATRGRNFDA